MADGAHAGSSAAPLPSAGWVATPSSLPARECWNAVTIKALFDAEREALRATEAACAARELMLQLMSRVDAMRRNMWVYPSCPWRQG